MQGVSSIDSGVRQKPCVHHKPHYQLKPFCYSTIFLPYRATAHPVFLDPSVTADYSFLSSLPPLTGSLAERDLLFAFTFTFRSTTTAAHDTDPILAKYCARGGLDLSCQIPRLQFLVVEHFLGEQLWQLY